MIASRSGLVTVFSVLLMPASSLRAQPRIPAAERVLFGGLPAGALPLEDVEPLGEVLAREVGFMAKVGQLSPHETDDLRLEAQKTLRRWGARIDSAALAPSLRRELTPLLKDISRPAWEKFDAERERLESRRRHAAMLTQVAELDQALVLTAEQRRALCELMSTVRAEAWWRPANVNPRLNVEAEASQVSAGLGCFVIHETELATILRDPQLAAYRELQRLGPIEIVIDQGAEPPVRPWQQIEQQQRRRLELHLSLKVGDAATCCDLQDDQREKLLMAGKLDINAAVSRLPLEPEQVPKAGIQVLRAQSVSSPAAAIVFDASDSAYYKAIEHRLGDRQRQKLAAAVDERRRFQRQAVIELVIADLLSAAALTSQQCDEFSGLLNHWLADAATGSPGEGRIDWLRHIARLPDDTWRPALFDFQRRAAEIYLKRFGARVADIEARAAEKSLVLQGVRGFSHGQHGRLQLQWEADEVKLNLD